MPAETTNRGGAAVGFLDDLTALDRTSVRALRLWCAGPQGQARLWCELSNQLGAKRGKEALKAFETVVSVCMANARRPLMRHHANCNCLGADEACFAHLIAASAEGDREDAMMFAMLMASPDVAPVLVSLAEQFGTTVRRATTALPNFPKPTHSAAQHLQ